MTNIKKPRTIEISYGFSMSSVLIF